MNDEVFDGIVSTDDDIADEVRDDDTEFDTSGNDIDDGDFRASNDIEVFDYTEVLENISYQTEVISQGICTLICLVILIFLYRVGKCIVARFNNHGRSV